MCINICSLHCPNNHSACLQLPLDSIVLQRIILVLASISVRDGGVGQFCSTALSLAAGAQSAVRA